MTGGDGTGVVDGYPGDSRFREERWWVHLISEIQETAIDGAAAVFRGWRTQIRRTIRKPPPAWDR